MGEGAAEEDGKTGRARPGQRRLAQWVRDYSRLPGIPDEFLSPAGSPRPLESTSRATDRSPDTILLESIFARRASSTWSAGPGHCRTIRSSGPRGSTVSAAGVDTMFRSLSLPIRAPSC